MAADKNLETKRKIISFLKKREQREAFKLFYKSYNQDSLPEIEFLENFHLELNKEELFKEDYELFAKIEPWFLENSEFQNLFSNVKKIFVNNLILKGNNLSYEYIETQRRLDDGLKRADSLSREKIAIANEKQLATLNKKTKDLFEQAISIDPENITAYKGLCNCLQIEGNTEEVQKVLDIINKYSPQPKQQKEVEQPKEIKLSEITIDKEIMDNLNKLFAEKKYEEVVKQIEKFEKTMKVLVPALLLKARALVELRRFKEADSTIYECDRLNTHFPDVKALKEEIAETKHQLYIRAGSIFLKRGIELGVALGLDNFKRAKLCLTKALAINPDNLDLLDQTYTTLKYLGEHEAAFKIKGQIYSLDPHYKTTYDNMFNRTMCYIATYAFYDSPQIVDEFRWFRREFILTNKFGRRINTLYVLLSSRITSLILNNNYIRRMSQILLILPLIIIKLLKILFNLLGIKYL